AAVAIEARNNSSSQRLDSLGALAGVGAIVVLVYIMSNWVGADGRAVTLDTVWILLTSLPMAVAWLAAAIGFGWPLRRMLARESQHALALQIALGVAVMLVIDAELGAVGFLAIRLVAW